MHVYNGGCACCWRAGRLAQIVLRCVCDFRAGQRQCGAVVLSLPQHTCRYLSFGCVDSMGRYAVHHCSQTVQDVRRHSTACMHGSVPQDVRCQPVVAAAAGRQLGQRRWSAHTNSVVPAGLLQHLCRQVAHVLSGLRGVLACIHTTHTGSATVAVLCRGDCGLAGAFAALFMGVRQCWSGCWGFSLEWTAHNCSTVAEVPATVEDTCACILGYQILLISRLQSLDTICCGALGAESLADIVLEPWPWCWLQEWKQHKASQLSLSCLLGRWSTPGWLQALDLGAVTSGPARHTSI